MRIRVGGLDAGRAAVSEASLARRTPVGRGLGDRLALTDGVGLTVFVVLTTMVGEVVGSAASAAARADAGSRVPPMAVNVTTPARVAAAAATATLALSIRGIVTPAQWPCGG